MYADWGVREFLLSILGALAGRLALEMGQKAAEKDRLLTEVSALTGLLVRESLNLSGGISVLGSGVTGGKSKSTTVHRGEVALATLQQYLGQLMARVREAEFAGAILHLNNLELLARHDSQRLRDFFDETRDCLQTPDIYFVFVGYTGMFQEIIVPLERVRSIFLRHPIHLPPLSLADVHRAVKRRYKILAIKPDKWIRPVADELIDHLYDVFAGKIRFIMDSITTLVARLPEGVTGTISVEAARGSLRQIVHERVRSVLTDAELGVLEAAVKQGRFTNSSLVKATRKSKQNVAKYVRRLVALNFACLAERKGRSVHYETSPELALLRPSKNR